MAYSTGKTSALQTAIKAGVDIALAEYAAELATGAPTQDILFRVHQIADELKVELFAQVDEDNQSTSAASGSAGFRGTARADSPVSGEDAKSLVLNFGAFRGMTIGDVLLMTADETKAYTGGKYLRTGLDYIKWMATNKDPKGAFAAKRAKVALDEFNAQSADLAKLAK
jgi:hypothetical protein